MTILKWNSVLAKTFCALIYLIIIWGMAFTLPDQNESRCLTLQQVLNLLKKVDQKKIIEQVERFGVDFELGRQTTARLVRAGAEDALLEAIEVNYCAELKIISPAEGAECGANVKVEGQSRKFPNKDLWIFAHMKSFKDKWWPQPGPVNLEEDGRWSGVAFLGGPQDIGFDFEIKALWVDSSVNEMLKDYLRRGDQAGEYFGIALPEGSPSAMVTVKKVRH